ncbi:hypothetical protein FOF60_21975 [Mesobacillus jeotgali]|nr:hypothetical protein FOF60_21975 [Mesobacillus jeotgali]
MNIGEGKVNQEKDEIVFSEEAKLAIPVEDRHLLKTDMIIVGIRPEHLKAATKETKVEDKIYVKTTNVEVLGNETIFSFDMGGREWMAKWTGQWRIDVGDLVPIVISYDSVCLFDSSTEKIIKIPTDIENHVFDKEVFL